MSLKKYLEGHSQAGNTLSILIIRKLQPHTYIVGDSSALALLKLNENHHHEPNIAMGMTVKLIKPRLIDNQTIETNKNFKPIKNKEAIKLQPTEKALKQFKVKEEDIKIQNNLITFQSIQENQSQTNIPSITFMVSNVSRIIETKTGKYQIAGILDKESQKTSINLYDSNIGKFEFGKIYTLTKIKKSIIRKDNEEQMRLMTTKFTKIIEASDGDQLNFDNVKFSEHQIHGIILGFGDINSYNSCEKHWNKLDEEKICPKCEGLPPKIKIDFNTDLYVQDTNSEEIKSFLIFKRQVSSINMDDEHEMIETKMNQLEGTNCSVEFDEPEREDQPIIPKRLKLEASDLNE